MEVKESILNSVKKMSGIAEDYEAFDIDLILYINSVFSILHQMGVGPETTYKIQNAENTWDEFTEDNTEIEMVKPYVYMKVRLMFDPPSNSFVINSFNEMIKEAEYRLFVIADNNRITEEPDE